jgi:hypothetical protein
MEEMIISESSPCNLYVEEKLLPCPNILPPVRIGIVPVHLTGHLSHTTKLSAINGW